jgi:hypothetical protein
VGSLDEKGGYFELFFVIADVDNLYINIGGYFELSFVMAEVGNLHAKLGGSHGLRGSHGLHHWGLK